MSLIHDALKEMEKPTRASTPLVETSGIPTPGHDRNVAGWLVGSAIGFAFVLAGVTIWWMITKPGGSPQPPESSVAVIAPIPAPIVNVEPVSSMLAPETAPSPTGVTEAASVPAAVEPVAKPDSIVAVETFRAQIVPVAVKPAPEIRESSVIITDSSVAKPAATVSRSAARGSAKKSVRPTVAVPVPGARPVIAPELLFADFSGALEKNDLERGKALLDQLAATLPSNSLSLLRAQAWYAVRGGDLTGANRLYRNLLERLPGDENASLNLASLEARAGRPGEAFILINDLLQRDPESSAGNEMMKVLREGAR
ncbi:hypothetical protein Q9Q94_03465 [Uliginosibacterium sp. 31-16]|uniref:tetratricopeptide repeat protein n=1 Tax=Uliginosibacterium sp. 31-16 TaxID=3068315 RepID=UPI00273FD371|nr:tetratricopeptide repeat protein [Uliginosibacterium sp. 31-16]MDP5238570.1 hypothetical protein [Uliginosibacterium sp. 31-16]